MRKNTNRKKKRFAESQRGWKRHMLSVTRRCIVYTPSISIAKEASQRSSKKQRWKVLQCPEVFTIEENSSEVIAYMEKVRNVKSEKYTHLRIDMSQIEKIDNLSIMMLLSNISHASQKGLFVSGNYPNNPEAEYIFSHSGFLSHMQTLNKKAPSISESDGLIMNLGTNTFQSENADILISNVIKRISGSKRLYQRLNGIVGEMGGNAIQYAYHDKKHYIFGCFPEKDKVSFVFADSGYGILNTLRNTLGKQMVDMIMTRGPVSVLEGAFNQKYGSKTGEDNRNRGLPFIKQTDIDGYISNLLVITNNVLLNFAKPKKSLKFASNYSGTVYFWQVQSSTTNN